MAGSLLDRGRHGQRGACRARTFLELLGHVAIHFEFQDFAQGQFILFLGPGEVH